MKAKLRRIYAAVMALAITISLVTVPVQAAEGPQFSDVDGHWGEEAIVRWADYGVIEGSNGQFNPDASITRAEMAAVIARLLGLTETAPNTFTDVEADAWYAQAILRCAAAGIIQGSNGMANPNGTLTRQEAAVMLGRALGIQPDEGDVAFLDGEQVADWAAGYVSVMSDRGILNGVGGNQFAPLEDINRASVVTVLNNAIAAYANEPGATVQANGGLTLVAADDVTVTGTAADILVAQGAAEGEITVQADTTGTVFVNAAGATVVLAAGADVNSVDVAEDAAGARVVVEEDASVGAVSAAAPESEIQVSGTAEAVEAAATAGNAVITVSDGAAVGSITTAAAGTDITVSGAVETVTVAGTAGSTTVTANRGAAITRVDNSAEDVTISGSGTVERVTTSGNDTTINTDGTELTVAEGVTGVTENNKDVAAGETVTTDRPTSGGGSSSGGGSHSHSYTDGVCSCGAYDPAWAQVDSAEDWAAAVAAGQNIVVTAAFTADTQLNVPGAITVNGRNLTITSTNDAENAADAAGILVTGAATIKNLTVSGPNNTTTDWDEGEYGIKVYGTSGVTLQDVTVTSANAGIQVNSSAVTLAGTVTVSGNEWGGIEVCKSENAGMTAGTLNINGAAVVCTDTAVPAIWIDGTTKTDGVVNGTDGLMWVTMDNQIYYYPAGTNITITGEKTLNWNLTVENLTVAEDATLTVADGYTLEVTDTLTNNGTITGSGTVVAPGYARQNGNWVKLFDAGLGTEDEPYEIATAQQFFNVGLLTDSRNHFKLMNDIDMTGIEESSEDRFGETGDIYSLHGELDGGSHTITSKSTTAGTILYATDAVIKDVTFAITEHPVVRNATATTFENVTVTGTMTVANNCAAFVTYAEPSNGAVELTFNNCTANVTMKGIDGGQSGYNAIFVGYAYGGGNETTLTFNNCVNEGTLTSGKAAMFLGNNSANQGIVTINVTNCTNKGMIHTTLTNPSGIMNDFIATGSHTNNTVVLNNSELASAEDGNVATENGGQFKRETDQGLKIEVNDSDKSFNITAPSEPDVASYEITLALYAKLLNADGTLQGGTKVVRVSGTATVNAGAIESALRLYDFVDEDWVETNSGATKSTDQYGNTVYTLDGTSYYYFGSKEATDATLQGKTQTPTMISVAARDAEGNLLVSYDGDYPMN